MKVKFSVCFLATVLASSAFAKEVSVPFINKAVPAEGLVINYSTDGQYTQKVVCVFEDFYKSYLKYHENGVEKEALPFDVQEIYFTSRGPTWERTQGLDNLEQFHVDPRGQIEVKNTHFRRETAHATCFYIPEDSK